ncbi:hypothetical protein [Caldanaerobacter subterraneus]|uniref:hypothetical protein n=1 Tax=Caldanaerobacter subterraneus TaxID=911092 RepID=UPI0014796C83|nr:hypothetical protein [Caldanaerobacter subterraneus]
MRLIGIISLIIFIFVIIFPISYNINSLHKEHIIRSKIESIAEKYIKDVERDGYLSYTTYKKIEHEIDQAVSYKGITSYRFITGTFERKTKGEEVFIEIDYGVFSLLYNVNIKITKFGISSYENKQ